MKIKVYSLFNSWILWHNWPVGVRGTQVEKHCIYMQDTSFAYTSLWKRETGLRNVYIRVASRIGSGLFINTDSLF
jgi:hypothetical protein